MMMLMRTTVTINDELLAEVKLMAARQHRTIGSVLEEALVRLLEQSRGQGVAAERHRLPDFGYTSGLRAGVDLFDKEQLAALLEEDRPVGRS